MNARDKDVVSIRPLLLIEGSAPTRNTLAAAMEAHGYRVTACSSAKEALRVAPDCNPRHIVTELKLPDGSGLPLLAKLLKTLPDATVVVLTDHASIVTAVEAIKLGASDYLLKPASAERIAAALGRVGGDSRAPVSTKALSIHRVEWEYINSVLLAHDGNLSAAARTLSMHRRTLQRKLQKHPY
jgi:two-component system response regulator RegA